MTSGNGPRRLAIAVLAMAILLALPARAEGPRQVIPLVPGEPDFLPPSQRTEEILKTERMEVWRFDPSESFEGEPVRLHWRTDSIPPLRAGNILIVAATGGRDGKGGKRVTWTVFYGLDLATGQVLWKVPTSGFWVEPRVARGIVFFTQPDTMFRGGHVLSAHKLNSGEQLWSAPTDSYVLQAVLDNCVVVDELPQRDRSRGTFVAALDIRTGKEIWRFPHQPSAVRFEQGRLFVVASRGKGRILFRLDPATGGIVWEREIPGADGGKSGLSSEAYGIRKFNWDFDADRIHVILDGKVATFDADTGRELWRKSYSRRRRYPTALAAGGTVYAIYGWDLYYGTWRINWTDTLHAIDGATGKVKWKFGRAIHDGVIVSKDRVLVLNNTQDWRTSHYLLDARTGKRLNSYEGFRAFGDLPIRAEIEATDAYRILGNLWILQGPDGLRWLLSLVPVPPSDRLRDHGLLMEAITPARPKGAGEEEAPTNDP